MLFKISRNKAFTAVMRIDFRLTFMLFRSLKMMLVPTNCVPGENMQDGLSK